MASEAAGTVLLCLPQVRLPRGQLRLVWHARHHFFIARRWRELAQERAAALECNQAPQAIPSRKWPRCLIGATHASWPPCAALECIWAWFSYRRLPRLAASAASLVGPGMNTAPVAECRHVSRARTLVDLLSGTGEGTGGSLDRHLTNVNLCLPLPIVRLGTSALTCYAPRVHCRSSCVGSVAAGPLNRTEGASVQTASYWAPKLAGRDRSSSRSLAALLWRQPRPLQLISGPLFHTAPCRCLLGSAPLWHAVLGSPGEVTAPRAVAELRDHSNARRAVTTYADSGTSAVRMMLAVAWDASVAASLCNVCRRDARFIMIAVIFAALDVLVVTPPDIPQGGYDELGGSECCGGGDVAGNVADDAGYA